MNLYEIILLNNKWQTPHSYSEVCIHILLNNESLVLQNTLSFNIFFLHESKCNCILIIRIKTRQKKNNIFFYSHLIFDVCTKASTKSESYIIRLIKK